MTHRIVLLVTVSAAFVVAACGSTAVEDTAEYTALVDERDSLAAELDEARAELETAVADLDEVDDRLAVAEARLADAQDEVAANEELVGDLTDFLTVDLIRRAGFSAGDADCVTEGFVSDAGVRAAYLMLIGPDRIDDADEADAAIDEVNSVLADCGIEIPDAADEPPEPQGPPLEAMLRDVEVTGDPLPDFVEADDPAVGIRAPVLAGADYDGVAVTVDASADGPTMLVFLAHWCPYCNEEVPKLVQLHDEGRVPAGVNIVAVSSLVNPTRSNYPPDAWFDGAGWPFPVLADGLDDAGSFVAADAYGLRGVPYVILIDGDGIVTDRWTGGRSLDELAAALESLAP